MRCAHEIEIFFCCQEILGGRLSCSRCREALGAGQHLPAFLVATLFASVSLFSPGLFLLEDAPSSFAARSAERASARRLPEQPEPRRRAARNQTPLDLRKGASGLRRFPLK
ncbi:Hypothetical predicted protein [Podarcis lilfordi]|uniref:Transmembrane protein n=1 Tax=Podarcis lilfordi TaxID=74358 RepID=A0AA35NYZ7_9SAUR|nr:Hypothetical predicted protein [Podarcis lilfordi]